MVSNSDNVRKRSNKPGNNSVVLTLLTQLRSDDWVDSQAAAKQLVSLGHVAVPALIGELYYPASEVRRRAALALGEIGDGQAVEPLIDVLDEDEDGVVRWAAARALGELADSSAIPSLVSSLSDEDANVAGATARALAQIGKQAVVPLMDCLYHSDYRIRRYAAQALSEIADGRATQSLVTATKDEDNWVRFSAAEGLGAIGDADSVDALLDLLKDEESEVRGVAIVALGKIGDARAVPALEELRGDDGVTWDDRTVGEVMEEVRAQIEQLERKRQQKMHRRSAESRKISD